MFSDNKIFIFDNIRPIEMKTHLFHRIAAVILTVLMSGSSLGFSLSMHFCGGEISSFSFYGEADPCAMAQAKEEKVTHSCCESSNNQTNKVENSSRHFEFKDDCCHNESYGIDISDTHEIENFTLDLQQTILAIQDNFDGNVLFTDFKSELNHFHYYHPPPFDRDILVLYQVFRI